MRYLCIILIFMAVQSNGQSLKNFQKKNDSNAKERTDMLDLLRNDIKNHIEQDVVFVVDHFLVYGNYAWLEAKVQRKDGKPVVLKEEWLECCHVEALFKRVNSSWVLKLHGAFSSDVWYSCILPDYPDANRQIFTQQVIDANENCGN